MVSAHLDVYSHPICQLEVKHDMVAKLKTILKFIHIQMQNLKVEVTNEVTDRASGQEFETRFKELQSSI